MSVEEARKADAATEASVWDWIEPPKEIFDMDIAGPAGPMTIRVYRPQTESDEPLPVLLYFFGGGFVVGSLDTSEAFCRALCSMVSCVVVSVSYRLAPEHPFPAAIDDCYAAVQWVAENGDRIGVDGSRIAVAGDSNGGTLAAAASLMARDQDGPRISAQVLVYPAMQHGSATDSMRENVDPMFFNGISVPWFWGLYLADTADGDSPYASPLNASDHGGLPPALMITAEFCPLRDEGKAYADALALARVPVDHRAYADLPHGFLSMAAVLDTAREALDGIVDFLRRRLGLAEEGGESSGT
ncbi:alpha/beta hydrolase [Streptomyces sp. NPDC059766]|uniref:alpha/beta hydrolase n=1 Tax=Streptomyces sp. NPDC059766 TaxID=3346940 RepID=UPI00364AA8BF